MPKMIQQTTDEEDALASPVLSESVRKKGIRSPMKMKTPGMGTMLGGPKYKSIPSVGKITPMPFGESTQMARGGKVGGASKRADGCCTKGKTKGRMV